jgi:hypothetical protein
LLTMYKTDAVHYHTYRSDWTCDGVFWMVGDLAPLA